MMLHTVRAADDSPATLLDSALNAQLSGAEAIKEPAPDRPTRPALLHPAIARCIRANNEAYRKAREAGFSELSASQAGDKAYRRSMPPLAGREDIRNFIACVAHGMLLLIFDAKEASRLIYAAQVAYSAALEPVNRLPGRPRKEPEPVIPETVPGN